MTIYTVDFTLLWSPPKALFVVAHPSASAYLRYPIRFFFGTGVPNRHVRAPFEGAKCSHPPRSRVGSRQHFPRMADLHLRHRLGLRSRIGLRLPPPVAASIDGEPSGPMPLASHLRAPPRAGPISRAGQHVCRPALPGRKHAPYDLASLRASAPCGGSTGAVRIPGSLALHFPDAPRTGSGAL